METKEGELELQEWQKEILEMEYSLIIDEMENGWGRENEIPITQSQRDMLKKVLGDDFYIQDERVRETLEAVLELGFYYERDRKILNIARDCYLKGMNWIKRSYR